MELFQVIDYINDNNLATRCRKDEFKFQRYYLFEYVRKKFGLSLAKTGELFDRDHATVLNGIKIFQRDKGCEHFEEKIETLRYYFPMERVDKMTSVVEKEMDGLILLENEIHKKLSYGEG